MRRPGGRLARTVRIAAAGITSLFFLAPAPAGAAIPAGSAAEILDLQGKGERRIDAAADWQTARAKQALPPGAFVRTGEASKMALLFADQTQIRLHENSILQIKTPPGGNRSATTLVLSLGRAWMQTKRPSDSRLHLESPAATAAIRGTDWELSVDRTGKTMLTVLSGTVEFFNAQGSVTVAKGEAAVAEIGKVPVKIQLSNPGDRIQWVNALTADPMRHIRIADLPAQLAPIGASLAKGDVSAARTALLASETGIWPTILSAAVHALGNAPAEARSALKTLLEQHLDLPAAAYLLSSDLDLVGGNTEQAILTLQEGLRRRPDDLDLRAQLARIQLLADRVEESERTLAGAPGSDNANILLARGDLARRKGDATAAFDAYRQAGRARPEDDRAWFSLGSAQSEREDTVPARRNLTKALELNPQGAGYLGELGMLDTLVNRFAAAQASFAQALAQNPADYLALTGQGLLLLKQGRAEAALEAFLQAGVMEPRYARAKTYTAVAYYQLGRHRDAVSTLRQACELDDKDPVPYLLLSQIYTDLFRAEDAVQASREAVKRLPYLKSLNQLANNQKGTANLGAALAFFGLEDWALELAQQSHYPYWGGSHLFLADRYAGEFNKNSKLFQGFLSDPLAFGAGNRFSTLLQRSGNYGAADVTLDKEFSRMGVPAVTLNGLNNKVFPIAYFLQQQRAVAREFPIEVGVSGVPAYFDPSGRADVFANVSTLGLGAQPLENLGVFAYHNGFDMKLRGGNNIGPAAEDPIRTRIDHATKHHVFGLSYRWSPTDQTWFKSGSLAERTTVSGMPTMFSSQSLAGMLGLFAKPVKKFEDVQLKHFSDLTPTLRASVGIEGGRESQSSEAAAAGMVLGVDDQGNGNGLFDILSFAGVNRIERRLTTLAFSLRHSVSRRIQWDGTIAANRLRERVDGESEVGLLLNDIRETTLARKESADTLFALRLGGVFEPRDGLVIRAAYQDWLRPLGVATLNDAETAGIPIDDRLVEAGGRSKRHAARLAWTPNEHTFVSLTADRQRIRNPGTLGVDLRTPSLPFLNELRNAQTVNLSTMDTLEGAPEVERGEIKAFSAGVDRILRPNWSGYLKFVRQSTHGEYDSGDAPSGRVAGKYLPYLPRDTFVIGSTWTGPNRFYLNGRMLYRSERFADKENLAVLSAGWSADLIGMWESSDKHWTVGMAALNLGRSKSPLKTKRFVAHVRHRF
ncbi:MAG TPA: tetratricopeptide repeat protein [Paucimonas sp.]|nr:tetratricopeptide repeat protein [Paucimonas sp.]